MQRLPRPKFGYFSRSYLRPEPQLYRQISKLQCRHYARKRPVPAFNAGGDASFKSTKSETKDENTEYADRHVQEPANRLRRWLSPGKVLLLSVCGFLGYKFYSWQTNPHRSTVLDSRFFTPFIFESKEPVSPTSSVLNLLSVPSGQNISNISEAWRTGVWSVQVMQPDLQIQRSYTPLPPTEEMPNELLRLFVRKEDKGEVSGFLHRIPYGTLVHLRGPHLEYQIPEDVEEVLFLAGGTGIAPALQVAHCLFNIRPRLGGELPIMRILWANRRREDSRAGLEPENVKQFRLSLWTKARNAITTGEAAARKQKSPLANESAPTVKQTRLVEEVEQLASSSKGRLIVEYFVDEEGSRITDSILRSYLDSSRAPADAIVKDGKLGKKLLLVSGPDGFVAYYAGPKEWRGGKEVPGPLGGLLKQMNPQGWDIWTL